MSKKKIQIHQFNPVIYPRKLWVVKGKESLASILDMFSDYNDKEIKFDEDVTMFGAITINVIKKRTFEYGVLVWMREEYDVKTIAHESVHFASLVFSSCNMTMGFDCGKDEHFAYLVGFSADCINQVVTNKNID